MKAAVLIIGGIIISLALFGPVGTAALMVVAFLGMYLLGVAVS